MSPEEINYLIVAVNQQVDLIVRGQEVMANVNRLLDNNIFHPFEQDYIYAAHYEEMPSQAKEHFHGGVRFTTRILHQTGVGMSDIRGGDLLYQIEGNKFGIVQYKRSDRKNRVENDLPQLNNLVEACPLPCHDPSSMSHLGQVHHWCGSYYCVIDSGRSSHVRACEAKRIFDDSDSRKADYFRSPLAQSILPSEDFNTLFASCRIGTPINVDSIVNFLFNSVEAKRLVFYITQHGRFGS